MLAARYKVVLDSMLIGSCFASRRYPPAPSLRAHEHAAGPCSRGAPAAEQLGSGYGCARGAPAADAHVSLARAPARHAADSHLPELRLCSITPRQAAPAAAAAGAPAAHAASSVPDPLHWPAASPSAARTARMNAPAAPRAPGWSRTRPL